jgi:hypothetical protein
MARSEFYVGRSVVLGVVANLFIGLLLYVFGFMTSYFLNDMPSTRDHVTFMASGLATAVVSTIFVVALTGKPFPAHLWAFVGSISVAVNATFLGVFFAGLASDFGSDPTYVYDAMSTGQVRALGYVCLVLAVMAIGAAITIATRNPEREATPQGA